MTSTQDHEQEPCIVLTSLPFAQILSTNTRRTKVVELTSGTHRCAQRTLSNFSILAIALQRTLPGVIIPVGAST